MTGSSAAGPTVACSSTAEVAAAVVAAAVNESSAQAAAGELFIKTPPPITGNRGCVNLLFFAFFWGETVEMVGRREDVTRMHREGCTAEHRCNALVFMRCIAY